MSLKLTPDLRLVGQHALLEPLTNAHHDDLCAATMDGELWKLKCTTVPSPTTMAETIASALRDDTAARLQFPFVVRRLSDNKVVGCTRYYWIRPEHRNLSIGFTWYAKSVQRTAINTECKFLLFKHAFEELGCISVALHVDDTNTVSQKAVERLGAKHEGVLRNDRIMPDGRIRHTYCYSITNSEWPAVKERLKSYL